MKKTEIQRIVGATAGVFVLLLLLYAVPGMIKQSRQQLGFTQKELLKNLPGASFICHADDTSILYANDELIQLFECDSREDFNRFSLGLFKNLIHPGEIPASRNLRGSPFRHLDGSGRAITVCFRSRRSTAPRPASPPGRRGE